MAIVMLNNAAPLDPIDWRQTVLRVTRDGALAASHPAGAVHDAARCVTVQTEVSRLARGELAILFLGDPVHTTIERVA